MKKLVLVVLTTALLVLSLAAVAQAYDPIADTIYNDYAADRDLDGPYTPAQLQAYLDAMGDPLFLMYKSRGVYVPLEALVTRILLTWETKPELTFAEAQRQALAGASTEPTASDDDRSTFPFTGFEAMLVLAGGLVLVGSGFVIRRAARQTLLRARC